MKSLFLLNRAIFYSLLIFLLSIGIAYTQNSGWKLDFSAFTTSDDPYQGWKITDGSAEIDSGNSSSSLILYGNPSNQKINLYHYVPYAARYLQIQIATDSPDIAGGIANVSSGGGIFGSISSGLATFDLSQHPYFQNATEGSTRWALRFWLPVAQMQLEKLQMVHEVTNGILLETNGDTAKPTVGDQLTATLHTTDKALTDKESVQAELVIGNKRKILRWNEQTVELKKESEGTYIGKIEISDDLIEIL